LVVKITRSTLLQDGKVLVAGGGTVEENYFGEPLASTELYDPNTENWYSVGPLHRGRQGHSATLLPNGKVLVAGGIYLYREMLGGTELWDPSTKVWEQGSALNVPRGWGCTLTVLSSKHISETALPQRTRVLLVGGNTESEDALGQALDSAEICTFEPAQPPISTALL
jgi:hypothetical protein